MFLQFFQADISVPTKVILLICKLSSRSSLYNHFGTLWPWCGKCLNMSKNGVKQESSLEPTFIFATSYIPSMQSLSTRISNSR